MKHTTLSLDGRLRNETERILLTYNLQYPCFDVEWADELYAQVTANYVEYLREILLPQLTAEYEAQAESGQHLRWTPTTVRGEYTAKTKKNITTVTLMYTHVRGRVTTLTRTVSHMIDIESGYIIKPKNPKKQKTFKNKTRGNHAD